MKKSVGLVVLTEIPRENGEKVLAVVLQRRGFWNMEKMKPESFTGCCQVTVHGGLEEGETFPQGLIRETKEELGAEFALYLRAGGIRGIDELVHTITDEKEIITFGAFVEVDQIKTIRLAPESGGLDIADQSQIEGINGLIEILPEMKKIGCPPSIRAMFPNEIKAVRKAFEIFRKS